MWGLTHGLLRVGPVVLTASIWMVAGAAERDAAAPGAVVPGVHGQGPAIDLEDAVHRALEGNPALAVDTHRRDAQEGRVLQSGLKPNLELDLEVENVLGTGPYSGIDGAETTLSVVWVLERGKRQQRVAAAEAGLALLDAETRIRRLDVAAGTARAFVRVLTDQQRLIQAEEGVALAERASAQVARRVDAGRSPTADLARAEVDLAWSRLALEDVEHELLVSRRVLASSWGASQADFSAVSGDVYRRPEAGTFAGLMADLEGSPMLSRYLSELRVREAAVRLAEAEARPDWRLRAGARYLNLAEEGALVAGISMPLAMRNRNQGRIAEARALAALADSERTATRLEIETTLFGLHQELKHNLQRAGSMENDVLPRAEQVLADAERAYAAGRYTYLELRIAQRELLAVQAELLEESQHAHWNRIEIERLTGLALPDRGRPGTEDELNGEGS